MTRFRIGALAGALLLGASAPVLAQAVQPPAAATRTLTVDDLLAPRQVSDPQLSPEGGWVAYVVKVNDLAADKASSHLWMTSWEGARTVQLTSRASESESAPRWSPDGKRLAFLSGRTDEHQNDQLWLLDRAGGEAQKVTEVKGSVLDYAWAPDGRRLALIVQDGDDDGADDKAGGKPKTPKPIVIDRFQFKQDIEGYLGAKRQRLFILDLDTRKVERVTSGDFDETQPAWSPDGKSIAFVSKREKEFDRDENWDVYVVAAVPGSEPRAVTRFEGADNHPDYDSPLAWSPDSRSLAYVQGGAPKLIGYAVRRLAVAPVDGGPARVLTGGLDRNIRRPVWSADGRALEAIVEDDGAESLVRVSVATGKIEPVLGGRRVISAFSQARDGHTAVLVADPRTPAEVYAVDGGALKPLSRQNEAWLKTVKLGEVRETRFASKDGTEIHGFLVTPPDYRPGTRYPTLLRIHGGPTSQFGAAYNAEWQVLAAQGYVVVAANPRGSTGRGEAFASAIYADWGNKDAQDVLAAVDDAVAKGFADPNRLGVGGWSYGGMLTNYVIAQDGRFKAATSGASIANILAGYGTDQYIRDYEVELGTPWSNTAGWMKISFPFYHADRIRTPTLFLAGEKDFNVPLLNSEQMYQALRSQGVDTKLIIYPGQFHGLTKPSYLRDRIQRYVDWYATRVKGAS
jgi:dipeptidyl aminopeptidase/acylaminoacyl peptidase